MISKFIFYLCTQKNRINMGRVAKTSENRLSSFPMNKENPFLKQAVQEVNRSVVRKWKNTAGSDAKAISLVVDPESGEMVGQTTFMRRIEVDEDKFTKLYLDQFQAFFDLTTAGIRVFGYIMTCMRPRNDMILFDREQCQEYTHYKAVESVYKGLTELVKAGIIARGSSDNLYFINPLIAFNGDRARFVHEYVKKPKKTKKVIEDPNQLRLDFDGDGFTQDGIDLAEKVTTMDYLQDRSVMRERALKNFRSGQQQEEMQTVVPEYQEQLSSEEMSNYQK